MDDGLLYIVHDLFGLIVAAMNDQPTRAFGDVVTEKDDADAKERSETEGESPGELLRNEVAVEEDDRDSSAECGSEPVGGVDDKVDAAAQTGRDKFVDGGVDGCVLAADAEAGDEAEERVAVEVPRESRSRGGQQIDEKRDSEELLAAEAVGKPAEEECADDRSGEVTGGGLAYLRIGHAQARLENAADGPGERDLQAVEHPGDAKGDDDEPVPSGPGESIETRGDAGSDWLHTARLDAGYGFDVRYGLQAWMDYSHRVQRMVGKKIQSASVFTAEDNVVWPLGDFDGIE